MNIKLEALITILELIVKKAHSSGIENIDIDIDYYWNISSEDKINFTKVTPEICVGSLIDDIEELKKLLDQKNTPSILDFDRLGNLIILIGEKLSKSNNVF